MDRQLTSVHMRRLRLGEGAFKVKGHSKTHITDFLLESHITLQYKHACSFYYTAHLFIRGYSSLCYGGL